MHNPYKIAPPFYVSFSGGRTSGYLLRKILDAWGGSLPKDGYVLFANTGKEHEKTLEFISEVERRWCPIVWLEWRDGEPQTFEVVNFGNASRRGEPFSALIKRKNMLPTPIARWCTGSLKVETMQRYIKSLGYRVSEVDVALGIRADEPKRIAGMKGKKYDNIQMPLASSGVTRSDVEQWWKTQDFDLMLPNNDNAFGNCDLCFLKSPHRLERVIEQDPKLAEWWIEMEKKNVKPFRLDRPTYSALLHQVTIQGKMFDRSEDDTVPCECTE